jgi:hypothetical protein
MSVVGVLLLVLVAVGMFGTMAPVHRGIWDPFGIRQIAHSQVADPPLRVTVEFTQKSY